MDGDGAKNLQIERLRILSEGLAHLLSTDDPDRLVRELFPTVAAHLRVDTYFNYMVNEAGDALFLHSYAGIPKEEADRKDLRSYREESARRESSEPQRISGFGSSLLAAIGAPNKAQKTTR